MSVACALAAWLLAAPPLTPDEAVRRAIERSGTVKAAFLDAEIAAAEDGLSLDPLELRLGHRAVDGPLGRPYTDNDGVPYAPLDEGYVVLGFKPPKPEDAVALLVAEDAFVADKSDAVQIERDFAAEVRLLHAQVLALRAEAELAQAAVAIAKQLEDQTQARARAQVGTVLDVRLAALERLDAAGDAQDVEADALRAEHQLAALVGLPTPLALAPGASPLCAMPVGTHDDLVRRAMERSEKLAEFSARRKRAETQVALGWTSWMPYVDNVLLGWYNEPLDDRDSMRLRLDIALPVFAPLSNASRVASLERRRAEAMHAEELLQIEGKIRSALSRLERALAMVRLFEESQAEVVERSLADVARALEVGEADVLRMSEVQRRALRARRGLIRARFRCDEAAIELARVTGDVGSEGS